MIKKSKENELLNMHKEIDMQNKDLVLEMLWEDKDCIKDKENL